MIYVFATFEKTGNLRYISHLDLQRAFTRLLLRSGLPVVFSEGFNPHPKLTFAQPLSIFQESVCEIAEFRLPEPTDEREVLDALRAVSPEGLRFRKVEFSEKKLRPCVSARYELTFRTAMSAEEMKALFDGELPVVKKTKTREVTVDIAPLVREKTFEDVEGGVRMTCLLPCGNDYLNPNYLSQTLGDRVCTVKILRTELFF